MRQDASELAGRNNLLQAVCRNVGIFLEDGADHLMGEGQSQQQNQDCLTEETVARDLMLNEKEKQKSREMELEEMVENPMVENQTTQVEKQNTPPLLHNSTPPVERAGQDQCERQTKKRKGRPPVKVAPGPREVSTPSGSQKEHEKLNRRGGTQRGEGSIKLVRI